MNDRCHRTIKNLLKRILETAGEEESWKANRERRFGSPHHGTRIEYRVIYIDGKHTAKVANGACQVDSALASFSNFQASHSINKFSLKHRCGDPPLQLC